MTARHWQRSYLVLVVARHAGAVAGLLGFVMLVCASLPSAVRGVGAVLLVGGMLGFVVSLIGVAPLIRQRLGRSPKSLVEFSSTGNTLTGHDLVAEATADQPSLAWVTNSRLRSAMVLEAALFVAVPVVAALTA
jgi:hypothetical protein